MKIFLFTILLLCLPSVSQASIFGFVFGTDHPSIEIAKSQMKHERSMAKQQSSHELKMAKMNASHQKTMAKRGILVRVSSSKRVTHYHQQGNVRIYHIQ